MAVSLLADRKLVSAVSNIKQRSERQPDVNMLRRTYVETGVFPQLNNANNQILYGRRGTGKSHVLRILEVEASQAGTCTVYIDVRVLGSAQMMADDTRPLVVRYVSVFKDLVFLIQGELMDIATDPNRDGNGMEEVSDLADAIAEKNVQITRREIELARESRDSSIVKGAARLSPTPSLSGELGNSSEVATKSSVRYTESLGDTVVFAEIGGLLDCWIRP